MADVDDDKNEVTTQSSIVEQSLTGDNDSESRYTSSFNQCFLVGHKMALKLPDNLCMYSNLPSVATWGTEESGHYGDIGVYYDTCSF